jgi:hypothetical protein
VHVLNSLRRVPRLVAVLAVVAIVGAGAVAYAGGSGPGTTGYTPNKADQVTNIDVLRAEIKNYYGVPNAKAGPTGTWADPLNPDSNYAHETESVASEGTHWLTAQDKVPQKAIVLDVDDTTLATWNYELFSNWDYNPATNAQFVNDELFPAVPGMVAMVDQAKDEGYAVFFITGRPDSQAAATLGNLANAGYPAPDALFTKPPVGSYPSYLDKPEFCATAIANNVSCATIPYKSGTRAHIENDLGYEIVGDFGDQYSDLLGGYADKTFKVPNPNYYLP